MHVGELCTRDVVFVGGDATAREIAGLMRQYHVGDVVVVEEHDGHRFPVGIVTDRDLVIELIATEVDIESVTAADFMSGELLSAREADDVWDSLERMRAAGVRRLPVTNELGHLAGMLTLDDVVEFIGEELDAVIRATGREREREGRLRG